MQNLQEKHGYSVTDRVLRFLRIRLMSRPQTKAMAEAVQQTRVSLRDANEVWLEAREVRAAATAEIAYLDGSLGTAVVNVSRLALTVSNGNRNADLYKNLFPIKPSKMMAPITDATRSRAVSALIAALREPEMPPLLATAADTLQARFDAFTQAIKNREILYASENTAAAVRRRVFDTTRAFYRQTYNQLCLLFPDDKALVESFFTPLSKSKKDKASASSDDAED